MRRSFNELFNDFAEARNSGYRTNENRMALVEDTLQAVLDKLREMPSSSEAETPAA
jgi:hypothetical protein